VDHKPAPKIPQINAPAKPVVRSPTPAPKAPTEAERKGAADKPLDQFKKALASAFGTTKKAADAMSKDNEITKKSFKKAVNDFSLTEEAQKAVRKLLFRGQKAVKVTEFMSLFSGASCADGSCNDL
jgi:hypothetical protein